MTDLNLIQADYPKAIISPSPNFGMRALGMNIDMIVLHYTGMPEDELALNWLCDRRSQVSSHYFICQNGIVHQLVNENARAWHAGKAFWKGISDINSCSIGIELANPGHDNGYCSFPMMQIASVIRLCHNIIMRYKIPAERILAHSDVAPERKKDPGELFPWEYLAKSGIGCYIPSSKVVDEYYLQAGDHGDKVIDLQLKLTKYGYTCSQDGVFDELTRSVVIAFQRHFYQIRVDGVVDSGMMINLNQLISM